MRYLLATLAGLMIETTLADYLTPLPVAPQGRALLLFEAEPIKPVADKGVGPLRILGGRLIRHTAESVHGYGNRLLVLRKQGYSHSSATWRFPLDGAAVAARYEVWTSFALGGVATESFTIRSGSEPDELGVRSRFQQSVRVSWKMAWRRAPVTVALYPGDKWLEITLSGMATQQKNVDAFLLVEAERLPERMTVEEGRRRAVADSFRAAAPDWRFYVYEGKAAKDADPFFRFLASDAAARLEGKSSVTTFLGERAERLAGEMQLEPPALVVMDGRHTVRGVLTPPASQEEIADFVSDATADGPAPGPFPTRPGRRTDTPRSLHEGSPRAWLAVDQWGGPAGLSLWGIDAEATLRPNPGQPCLAIVFDSRRPTHWRTVEANNSGMAVINPSTSDYTWPRGVGYAHLYLHADRHITARLHLIHTGVWTAAWLDGERVAFGTDPASPIDLLQQQQQRAEAVATGVTDQGNRLLVRLGRRAPAQVAALELTSGWHRLLVKLVMQHKKGDTFAFAAKLTDLQGAPMKGVQTRLSDPEAALDINADAMRLNPLVYANAPANLVHPGQPLKLRVDLRRLPRRDEGVVMPLIPFDAKLTLLMTDYDGKEVTRREVQAQFPSVVTVDLGKAPETGYYAVHGTLYDREGEVILVCPPDGFSVIRGTAAQYERRGKKKMAVTYYFMGSGERATYHQAFPWMTRMGIYRNIGSNPGFPLDMAEAAKKAGITLTMDFWDIHNAYTQQKRNELAKKAAPYTRWFKSFNEVDINPRVRRSPEHWVKRTKGEYRAVKAARPDGIFVGGSLVRPGTDDWFTNCLKLGLDKYIDAWDVHAYPQRPPTLEGTLSNSPNETELGVLTCYKRLGRTNTKPFWIGETGARACHGFDARRWQADTIAKMVACVCSREDFHYVGFLWPWTHARGNDIVTAHQPGEAAYYTASALIDGFPYSRLDLGDKHVQAALFGETRMLWTTGPARLISVPLPDAGPWVIVDVVGRVRALAVGEGGAAEIKLTGGPVYVMSKAVYGRLTAFN